MRTPENFFTWAIFFTLLFAVVALSDEPEWTRSTSRVDRESGTVITTGETTEGSWKRCVSVPNPYTQVINTVCN